MRILCKVNTTRSRIRDRNDQTSFFCVATSGSTDTSMARDGLMAEPYGLSQEQADAILALRLGRLTSMEEGKLKAEAEDLKATTER